MGRKPLLTDEKVLTAVERWQVEHGDVPSIEELRRVLGVGSTRTVFRYLEALEVKGLIEREPLRIRRRSSQGLRTRCVPLVGTVAAGGPILAEENIEGWIRIPSAMAAPPRERFFLLHVKGNSMNRASLQGERIENGDLLLVRQRAQADSGEIVVALVDGEATVKRLNAAPGYWSLRPESTETRHKPIIVTEDFRILGIATRVFKRGSDLFSE